MDDVKQKAIELAQYLFKKQILDQDLSEYIDNDLCLFFLQIKERLNIVFPNAKLKPKITSIHYANNF